MNINSRNPINFGINRHKIGKTAQLAQEILELNEHSSEKAIKAVNKMFEKTNGKPIEQRLQGLMDGVIERVDKTHLGQRLNKLG